MEHIAVDLGGRESQVCIRDEQGTIVEERRWPTARLGEYFQKHSSARVVVETSAEAFAVADEALKAGHEVRVVPATLVRCLGVGSRGVKTDKKDAQVLSEASCRINLPSVHIPSEQSRDWKALCGARECLVESRTKLINHTRGWLRTKVKQVRKGAAQTFPKRVREKLLSTSEGMPMYIERQLCCIEALNEQILLADKELGSIALENETCRRLMTVPGVGPVTSLRFVAAVDEISRFPSAHPLQSYLGLTPGEDSSSQRERKTSITKAGAPKLRWALVQAAWAAWRTCPEDPMVEWAKEIAQRRGRRIAIVALSRKIAGILHALWSDGTTYDSKRGASPKVKSI